MHVSLLSPMDANYTGHREDARRRLETKEWLRKRERELGFTEAPPTAPEDQTQH